MSSRQQKKTAGQVEQSADMRRPRKMGRPSGDYSARSQILQGASQAFGQKGFAETSVEDICVAADVSRRTFYRFFRSKDDVFAVLYELGTKVLLDQVRTAVRSTTDAFEKIERGLDAYIRTQAYAGPIARVLVLEPMNPNSKFAARQQEVLAGYTELFRLERNSFEPGEVDPLVYQGLLAALQHVSIALLAESPLTEEHIQRGKQVMMRILTSTLMTNGEPLPPLPLLP